MGTVRTKPWDVADHLTEDADIIAYLDAALEDGDPQLVAAALGDVARARGMSQVARESGLAREALYRALSDKGNPELATALKVVEALGLKLHVMPQRFSEAFGSETAPSEGNHDLHCSSPGPRHEASDQGSRRKSECGRSRGGGATEAVELSLSQDVLSTLESAFGPAWKAKVDGLLREAIGR